MAEWLQSKFQGDPKGTAKPRKNYSTETHKRLSRLKKASWSTLGSEGLHKLVQTPEGENVNDWIALHVMDFFNEISLLGELATTHEDAEKFNQPGRGFPAGFVYKWRDAKNKKAQSVSAPDYINYSIAYIDGILDDPSVFPLDDTGVYPPDFVETAKEIYVKLFRVFAILYGAFLDALKEMEVATHLNTSFKHYIYFGLCHELMPKEKELKPLEKKVREFKAAYELAWKNSRQVSGVKPEKSFHAIDVETGAFKDL